MPPALSVVIPTRDRGHLVLRLVERLLEQRAGSVEYEILVVDDGSRAGATDAVASLAASAERLTLLRQENAGVAAARNRGARHARAARILFLDDDVEPPPGLLAEHVRRGEAPGCPWIAGAQCLHAPRPRPMDHYRAALEAHWRDASAPAVERVTGAHLSVDRERFLAIGGFDERIRTASAEDYLLALRAEAHGIPVVYAGDLVVLHHDSVGGVAWARRQARYAEATARLQSLAPRVVTRSRRVRAMAAALDSGRPLRSGMERWRLTARRVLASGPVRSGLRTSVGVLEALRAPLAVLRSFYRVLAGTETLRGWRRGRRAAPVPADLRYRSAAAPSVVEVDGAVALPPARERVEAVVVSYQTADLLTASLGALEGQVDHVTVVDNASADGSVARVERDFPRVRVIRNERNLGFARANNLALAEATKELVLLVNSDAEVEPGAVARLVATLDTHPTAALVSGGLDGPDGRPQHPARRFPAVGRTLAEAFRLHRLMPRSRRGRWLLGLYWNEDRILRADWVWGTFVLVRMEAVREVGPFDPDFFMYGEDMDWCARFWRAGWDVLIDPGARAFHHGGASASLTWNELERSKLIWDQTYRVVRRHRGALYERALRLANFIALTAEGAVRTVKGRPEEEGETWRALARHQLEPAGEDR